MHYHEVPSMKAAAPSDVFSGSRKTIRKAHTIVKRGSDHQTSGQLSSQTIPVVRYIRVIKQVIFEVRSDLGRFSLDKSITSKRYYATRLVKDVQLQ